MRVRLKLEQKPFYRPGAVWRPLFETTACIPSQDEGMGTKASAPDGLQGVSKKYSADCRGPGQYSQTRGVGKSHPGQEIENSEIHRRHFSRQQQNPHLPRRRSRDRPQQSRDRRQTDGHNRIIQLHSGGRGEERGKSSDYQVKGACEATTSTTGRNTGSTRRFIARACPLLPETQSQKNLAGCFIVIMLFNVGLVVDIMEIKLIGKQIWQSARLR
jgi:hypothetical protein